MQEEMKSFGLIIPGPICQSQQISRLRTCCPFCEGGCFLGPGIPQNGEAMKAGHNPRGVGMD